MRVWGRWEERAIAAQYDPAKSPSYHVYQVVLGVETSRKKAQDEND